MISYPFISHVTNDNEYGDRAITDEMERKFNSAVWNNGVCYTKDGNADLKVTADYGMNITINAGACVINGAKAILENNLSKKISAAHSSYNRIDLVVARFDLSDSVRSIDIYIKEGSPSTYPSAPSLVKENNYYELCLAEIRISKRATTINDSDITDTRVDAKKCGFISAAFPTSASNLVNTISESNNKIEKLRSDIIKANIAVENIIINDSDFEAKVVEVLGLGVKA